MRRQSRFRLVLIGTLLCAISAGIALLISSRERGLAVVPAEVTGERELEPTPLASADEPQGAEWRERVGAEGSERALPMAAAPGSAQVLQTVRVLVTDRRDEPIAGARVLLLSESPPRKALTDAAGRCELIRPVSDGRMLIAVDAEGHGHAHQSSNVRDPVWEVQVRLDPALTLRGRVLEPETSTPVPGARLRRSTSDCSHCDAGSVLTDANGHYELSNLPAGRQCEVSIEAQGYPRNIGTVALPLGLAEWEHDFTLDRGVPLQGQVVDYTSGQPISPARLRAWRDELKVNETGRFSGVILPSPWDHVPITVEAQGYCRIEASYLRNALEVAGPIQFRLPRGAVVEVHLKDREGEPISDAWVSVDVDHSARREQERREGRPAPPFDDLPAEQRVSRGPELGNARAVGAGVYRASELVPWEGDLELHVGHHAFAKEELELGSVGGPGDVLVRELVLECVAREFGTVFGRLTLNEEPVSRGHVSLRDRDSRHVGFIDAGGNYRIEGVVAGEVTIEVRPMFLSRAAEEVSSGTATLILEPQEELRHDIDFEIPMAEIRGQVTTGSGRPLPGIRISARSAGSNHAAVSEEDGTYALEVASLGHPFALSAAYASVTITREGLLAGSEGIDLVFPELGR